MIEPAREPALIHAYHAHVYYRPETRQHAAWLREAIGTRFAVQLGRWHDALVGPHSRSMYQVAFATALFADLVPFLLLNRGPLDILVHAETGDELADHTAHALWLGECLPLRLEALTADHHAPAPQGSPA